MSAYEIFLSDLMGDELVRQQSDRRQYYNTLRQALRQEVAGDAPCELLDHYANRLKPGAPDCLYLLDAAALWECYTATVGGVSSLRDLGMGLPFPMGSGRRLPWDEVQRLSDARTLPVAVMDQEMTARLQGLVLYARTSREKRAALRVPDVNPRAWLATAQAPNVKIPAPNAAPKDADAQKEIARLQEQLHQQELAMARLQEQRDLLEADCARLRGAQTQVNADTLQLVDMVLQGKVTEAIQQAHQAESQVTADLERLQQLQQAAAAAQARLEETQEQLRSEADLVSDLRARQQAKEQDVQQVRQECEQARQDAAAAHAALQAAEQELKKEKATLAAANEDLRKKQMLIARTRAAAEMTTRQADRLS